jgi:hypothetical protein
MYMMSNHRTLTLKFLLIFTQSTINHNKQISYITSLLHMVEILNRLPIVEFKLIQINQANLI